MVAITTYLQYKQWERKRKKEHASSNNTWLSWSNCKYLRNLPAIL